MCARKGHTKYDESVRVFSVNASHIHTPPSLPRYADLVALHEAKCSDHDQLQQLLVVAQQERYKSVRVEIIFSVWCEICTLRNENIHTVT